jgi:hypothetical protein
MSAEAPATIHSVPAAGSLLGQIREQQKDLAAGKTIDIPIAGYHRPELVARYRFISLDEAKELGEQIRKQYDSDVDRAEATMLVPMIEACEGLFAREGDKLEPVELPDGGGPCRYDDRLETFFGAEPSGSAREAILVAFKGNGHAAVNHGRLLNEWFGDTSKTIEQLLGEA